MRLKFTPTTAASLICVSLSALASDPVLAQSEADRWQWEMSVYGWFPGIKSTTEYPTGGSGPTMSVSSEDVIGALKFGAMGTFGGKLGKWGFWNDLVYSDVGGSQNGARNFSIGSQGTPAGVSANLNLDIKTVLWTVAGTYEVAKSETNTTDLLLGGRGMYVKETLNWSMNGSIAGTGLPGQSGTAQLNASLWDAVVGMKGQVFLGEGRRWFMPYYLDVGSGQSKYTWQINAGLAYRFDWGAAVLSWRHLDYQMKSGDPIQNMSMSGPVLGVGFQW